MKMTNDDLNADRRRWYGIRIGDVVEESAFRGRRRGVVVELDLLDNNAVHVRMEGDDRPVKMVAEWCNVIEERA